MRSGNERYDRLSCGRVVSYKDFATKLGLLGFFPDQSEFAAIVREVDAVDDF